MTYNQSLYIVDTMNGFTMQETNFPFVCTIMDDSSTDGEQEIIMEYLEKFFDLCDENVAFKQETDYANIVFAQHKKNRYCYFAVLLLKKNLYSQPKIKECYLRPWTDGAKYLALCEGDDFWICKNKLQMQVDFLDNNLDYHACFTKFYIYNQKYSKITGVGGKVTETINEMLLKDVSIATASFLYDAAIYTDYLNEVQPYSHNWLMGDKPLFFYFGYRGKVKMIDSITTVYRILDFSASHSNNLNLQLKRARNTIDIYHYFAQRYLNENDSLFNLIEGGYLYRAYHIFKKHHLPIGKEVKKSILSYNGAYYKLYAVKLFMLFPFLHSIVYFFLNIKEKLKVLVKKIKLINYGLL